MRRSRGVGVAWWSNDLGGRLRSGARGWELRAQRCAEVMVGCRCVQECGGLIGVIASVQQLSQVEVSFSAGCYRSRQACCATVRTLLVSHCVDDENVSSQAQRDQSSRQFLHDRRFVREDYTRSSPRPQDLDWHHISRSSMGSYRRLVVLRKPIPFQPDTIASNHHHSWYCCRHILRRRHECHPRKCQRYKPKAIRCMSSPFRRSTSNCIHRPRPCCHRRIALRRR